MHKMTNISLKIVDVVMLSENQNKRSCPHKQTNKILPIDVFIFCVEFGEFSHLSRDFSLVEKQIIVVTSEQLAK